MDKAIIAATALVSIALILFSYAPQVQSIHPNELTSTSSSPNISAHVQVYSSCEEGSQYLFVPLNSSGISVFPYWHIYLYGRGTFSFTVNDSIVEAGVAVNNTHFSFFWNESAGSSISALLNFDGTIYSFHDVISGPLNDQVINSVSLYSTLAGQNQILSVLPNQSGDIMYPTWTAEFHSSQRLNFSIYVQGKAIDSGYVLGSKRVIFNVSGSMVSVQIILGNKSYKYPNEFISSIPIEKYFGPKPPALQYTLGQYETGIAKGFIAGIMGLFVSLLVVRKIVVEKKKREVRIF